MFLKYLGQGVEKKRIYKNDFDTYELDACVTRDTSIHLSVFPVSCPKWHPFPPEFPSDRCTWKISGMPKKKSISGLIHASKREQRRKETCFCSNIVGIVNAFLENYVEHE